MLKRIVLCAMLAFAGSVTSIAQTTNHTFALGDKDFLLDGKPLQMISGEMHYERVPREYWRERIKMAKAMGLNTIGTYVFWNAHEPMQGHYDFTGNNDVAEFVRICKEEGMWVVMRPSPYACAEWEFGGYPWWLLKDRNMKVRSKEPSFINAYRAYMMEVGKQLAPLQVNHGGNILMVQIENEYGSYSNDKEYLAQNEKIFRDAGFDGVLFTCDGPSQMPAGYLPGFLPAVNGEDNPAKVKELINKYHNGKGPYYIAEWYPGWFDSWGKPHSGSNADEDAKKLDEVLAAGISINMYMFHGGTTRNFMNGANMSRNEPYSPQTSSYDYDAPLNEAGDPTPKFYKLRDVIAKHLPAGQTLPEIPQKRRRTYAMEVTKISGVANLFNNLGLPTESERPMSFEDLDQGYGLVLYRTTLANASKGLLKIKQLRDYATVYVNGKRVAVLDRRLGQDSVQLADVSPNSTLDILVENNGRINYGPYLTDNRKGITEAVILNGQELLGWKMYKFPLNSAAGFRYIPSNGEAVQQPVLYRGTFSLRGVGDTYLDMRAFGKGVAFVNGHNLGKYWYIGPQQTLFIPAAWLKKGTNEIVIFDELHNTDAKEITTIDHPILNELHK